jgi:hypothetical protein
MTAVLFIKWNCTSNSQCICEAQGRQCVSRGLFNMKAPIKSKWFIVLIFITSPSKNHSSHKAENSQGQKHLWLLLTRQRWSQSWGSHQRTWCFPGPRIRQPTGPWRPSSLGHAGPMCWGQEARREFLASCSLCLVAQGAAETMKRYHLGRGWESEACMS